MVKNPYANAGDARDMGSILGSGRSPGVGNGHPLQYSCLENFMDREAWWATGPGGCKESDTTERLSMHTCKESLVWLQTCGSPVVTLGSPLTTLGLSFLKRKELDRVSLHSCNFNTLPCFNSVLLSFWPCPVAHEILVSRPETKFVPPTLESTES